ncbi:type III PLP-dependent enzyme [Aliiroseovarius sediminis]|uniref:type III PLP-dependent enzyme n=1 Tax=Aliiroseovarius sediminis TaxID=2925839 RepID=UPI001F575310|nr:type III PLP-dependent enzyme [Aliiroseovarius sediminis]MCI2394993.1 type III PLP-dependent enzyme [Aliiroseovarius sediminis]
MSRQPSIWQTALAHLKIETPTQPVLYFSPATLQATARQFIDGFDGLVTYAVKANDSRTVLENLVAAGITAFDVASPAEMHALRAVSPDVAMHYNNPVRSRDEIAQAVALGVQSYSIDAPHEFDKLRAQVAPEGVEVAVRLRLPVAGAAYDFGAKFGADADQAVVLLRMVKEAGFTPSMTFHPGTQCAAPSAWSTYITTCAEVAKAANVRLARLNVGGGFAANRGVAPDLTAIFDAIHDSAEAAFGENAPALVCEPGRAMVAESFTLATRVKSIREDGAVFLNDGIYGALSEAPSIGVPDRMTTVTSDGASHDGGMSRRMVFGPTCDSIDQLPDPLLLPSDLAEDDYVLFAGMGAYSLATVTRFNGYGLIETVTVQHADL